MKGLSQIVKPASPRSSCLMLTVLKHSVSAFCTCMVYLASSRQGTKAGDTAAASPDNITVSGITFSFEFACLARKSRAKQNTGYNSA